MYNMSNMNIFFSTSSLGFLALTNLGPRPFILNQLSPRYETLHVCGTTYNLSKNTKIVIKVT